MVSKELDPFEKVSAGGAPQTPRRPEISLKVPLQRKVPFTMIMPEPVDTVHAAVRPPCAIRRAGGPPGGYDDGGKDTCPRCGSDALTRGPGKGPHFASIACQSCGKFIKWIARPIDRTEASRFLMPYGPFQGLPMGSLPVDELRWLSSHAKPGIAKRAAVLLEDPLEHDNL